MNIIFTAKDKILKKTAFCGKDVLRVLKTAVNILVA